MAGDGMSGSASPVIKETCSGAGRSRAGVRVPVVAMKRVMIVKPRGQEGEGMQETQLQITLQGVLQAQQGREVPPRWEWTEASVWTQRMLATLERGIKGGKLSLVS